MKIIVWLILASVLACGSGCARPDWIEATLVTEDVTGVWDGESDVTKLGGTQAHTLFAHLELEQQGPNVKGSLSARPSVQGGGVGATLGAGSVMRIEGAMFGDTFRFTEANGRISGELTVSADEMRGELRSIFVYSITLRRVNPRPRPRQRPNLSVTAPRSRA